MTEAALRIVDEYLGAEDIACRRKGVLALRAFESEPAISRLIDKALDEADVELRSLAERVLAELDGEQRAVAYRVLERGLYDPGPWLATYALLGRLRLLGAVGAVRLGRPVVRVRRAISLIWAYVRGGGWRHWLRGLRPGLVGLACAWLGPVFIGLLGLGSTEETWPGLLGSVMVPLVAVFTTPIKLHFDRLAGLAADAALAATASALVVAMLWLLLAEESTYTSEWLLALLAVPISVASVRAVGGILGGRFQAAALDAVAASLAAGIAGIVASGAVLWAGAKVLEVPLDSVAHWGAFWSASFAVAAVVWALDRVRPPRSGAAARQVQLLGGLPASALAAGNFPKRLANTCGGALIVVLALMIWVIVPRGNISPAETKLAYVNSAQTRHASEVSRVPSEYELGAPGRGDLTVTLNRLDADSSAGYVVELHRLKASDQPSRQQVPNYLPSLPLELRSLRVESSFTLEPSEVTFTGHAKATQDVAYTLRISRDPRLDQTRSPLLSRFDSRVRSALRMGDAEPPRLMLTIQWTEEAAQSGNSSSTSVPAPVSAAGRARSRAG